MPDMPSLTLSLSPAIITLCSLCRCVGKEFGDGIGLVGQSGYSRPRRAPLEPKLGRWVFPARSVEALRPCNQRNNRTRASFGPSTPNKSPCARPHRAGRTFQQLAQWFEAKATGLPSAEHRVRQPESNLAQLCSTRAGFRMRYWACS